MSQFVLVRRRVDGKYWRNLSYHARHNKEVWQEGTSGITPFKSPSGAKNALASIRKEDCTPHEGCCRWPFCSKHTRELREKLAQRFNEKYELVPVEVKIV